MKRENVILWLDKAIEKFFRILVNRYVQEQLIAPPFINMAITIFFVIISLVFMGFFRTYTEIGKSLEKSSLMILTFSSCWLVIQSILFGCTLCLTFSRSTLYRLMYRISIYMTIAFTYIIYPLMVWAYSSAICGLMDTGRATIGVGQFSIFSVFVAVGGMLTLFDMATRNNIPSRFPLSTISRTTEVVSYPSLLLTIAISQPLVYNMTSTMQTAFLACLDFVLGSVTVFLSTRRIFWHHHLDIGYKAGYCVTWWIKILGETGLVKHQSNFFLWTLLSLPFFIKVQTIFSDKLLLFDLTNAKISPIRKYLSGLLMGDVLPTNSDSVKSAQLNEVKFLGYLQSLRNSIQDCKSAEIQTTFQPLEAVDDLLLKFYLSKEKKSPYFLKAAIILHLKSGRPNFKDCMAYLHSLKVMNLGDQLYSKLEVFHLRKLLEARILSSNKTGSFETSAGSLFSIYDCMVANLESKQDDDEASKIFKLIERNKKLSSIICKELEIKCSIFRKLISNSTKSNKELFHLNQQCLESHQKVLARYNKYETTSERSISTYELGVLCFYFSMVRSSYYTYTKLRGVYKNRLTKIAATVNKPDYRLTLQEATESSSVAMRVSLGKNDLGAIQDISLNYFEFLGYVKNGSVTDQNVNTLLPDLMVQRHTQAIADLTKMEVVADHKRDIYITGFDGFLRRTQMNLKLVPSLKQSISCHALLSFNHVAQWSLVMVDRNMQIINAERPFWDYFDSLPNSLVLTNMNQISKSISYLMNIIEIYQQHEAASKIIGGPADSKQEEEEEEIISTIKRVKEANNLQGIRFQVDRFSQFNGVIPTNSIQVKFENNHCFGSDLIKMYVAFSAFNTRTRVNSIIKRIVANDDKDNSDTSHQLIGPQDKFVASGIPQNLNGGELFLNKTMDVSLDLEELLQPIHQVFEKWHFKLRHTKRQDLFDRSTPLNKTIQNAEIQGFVQKVHMIVEQFKELKNDDTRMEIYNLPIGQSSMGLLNTLVFTSNKDVSPISAPLSNAATNYQQSPEEASLFATNQFSSPKSPFSKYNGTKGFSNQRKRKEERVAQKRLAGSTNIVIASSNVIGTILNKVMKRDTGKRATDNFTESASVGSSIASKSDIVFVKSFDINFKKKRSFRIFNLNVFGVLYFLISIALVMYFYGRSIVAFSLDNHRFFNVTYNMVRLDTSLRRNANILTMEIIPLYLFLLNSLIVNLSPPTANATKVLKAALIRDYNNFCEALDTKLPLEFLINRRTKINKEWKLASNEYMENLQEFFGGENNNEIMDVIQNVTGSLSKFNYTSMKPYHETNKIGYFEFTQTFKIRAEAFLLFMKDLRPVMNGKEPPFNMPINKFLELFASILETLESVRNIFEGIMTKVEDTLDDLKHMILVVKKQEFDTRSLTFSMVLLVFAILYGASVLWSSFYLNRKLQEMMLVYQSLKYDEAVMNGNMYQHRLEVMRENAFNEVTLLEESGISRGPFGLFAKGKETGEGHATGTDSKDRSQKKSGSKWKATKIRVHADLYFSSSKSLLLSNLFMIVLLTAIFVLVYSVNSVIDKSMLVEEIFLESIRKLIPVSNNFLAYNLFVIYGNYIKIDGKFLEDYKDNGSVRKFQEFWVDKRITLPSIIGSKNSDLIQNILFGDLCHEMEEDDDFKIYAGICKKHIPTVKGFMSFLNHEDWEIQRAREDTLKLTSFLNASKYAGQAVNSEYFFQTETQRMDVLHDAITEIFIDKLFQTMESVLTDNFRYIDATLKTIAVTAAIVLAFIIAASFLMTFRLIAANTQVCRETFAVILPDTIFNNPHIYNAFERHFIKHL